MWAIILYVAVIISIFQDWLVFAVGLVLVFSFWYNSVLLIPLAILIDGYFGNFHTVPILSFGAVFWYVVVEFVRPKIANFRTI